MMLKQGMSGNDVRDIQLLLRQLGYPLSGTGYFGPSTDTAVEDFQYRYGMAVTGVVDDATAATIAKAANAAGPVATKPPLHLAVSLAHLGLKEAPGKADNTELVADIRTVAPDYQSDATPWCAGWVSFCLAKAGLKPSRSPLWALSYADGWGIKLAGPALGAVAVKKRNGGGHVTFVAGRTRGGALACCGGNQNDSVNISPYDPKVFLGFFWPRDYPAPARVGFSTLPIISTNGTVLSEA